MALIVCRSLLSLTPRAWPRWSACLSRRSRALRALPSYYLRYYYSTDEVLREQRDGHHARAGGHADRA